MALHAAIVELEEFTESINMLVYGDSGVGKTVLAGTAPRCLILRAENGAISAKRQGSTAKVWKVESWADFEAAFDWVESNPDAFDWIVIDSLTKVQQFALRAILDKAVADNPSRDVDIPAIQDHQKWQLMLKRYVVMFNDLPVNVLWTAQAMHKEDPEGEDLVLPLILGKNYDISSSICAEMNVVAYLAVRTVKVKAKDGTTTERERRELLVRSKPPYFAKDRYDCIGENGILIDPTMPAIIAAIDGSAGSSKPAATTRKATATPRRATARRTS
jgi:hypothetical protein